MRKVTLISGSIALLIIGSLLSGCGGSGNETDANNKATASTAISGTTEPDPDAGPEDTAVKEPVGGFGTYSFKYNGVFGQVEIPTPASDPRVKEFEAYRDLAGGSPVTYVVAKVDNQSLDQDVNMYQVLVVTDEGEQIEVSNASDLVDKWRDAFSTDGSDDTDKYNVGIDLSNRVSRGFVPGSKGVLVMGVAGDIPSVKRVFVYPAGGFDRVAAEKVS